jgi:membrane protein
MKKLAFVGRLFRDAFDKFLADRTLRMAGALAYNSVFSMAELVLIAVGVASEFFDKQAAREQILNEIRDTVGPSAKEALAKILQDAGGANNGVIATIVGVAILLAGASGLFAELQDALNSIWQRRAEWPEHHAA